MQEPDKATVLSVSELNRETRLLLERGFGTVWVEGELSGVSRPASGHLYFDLKDASAAVRCAMFRRENRALRFDAANGTQVLVRARVSLYEPRGSYQLIVEHMEEAGEGLLLRKLEETRRRLAAEGLFDEALKSPLPALPTQIGVVTSTSGAAVRDVLKVLSRRFPGIPVIVYPTLVQGEQAPAQIAGAIDKAAERAECDVLIVTRGGGSLEDLWSFNEEIVVRAIHRCPVPVISAVGHEVDVTLADLVADVRAPTPSAAAELVVPDQQEWRRSLASLRRRAARVIARRAGDTRERYTQLGKRLQRAHPGMTLRQSRQRVDDLAGRLGRALEASFSERRFKITTLLTRTLACSPASTLALQRSRNTALRGRLINGINQVRQNRRERLGVAAASLNAVSPLATLDRGYALVRDTGNGRVISQIADVEPGRTVTTRLADGEFESTVTGKTPGKKD